MLGSDDDELGRIAEAITDRIPVDWSAIQARGVADSVRLARLRLLERITAAHDAAPGAAAVADGHTLFEWGHLHVLSMLGRGGFGTVYRAFDSVLQREVALKLLHDDLDLPVLQTRRFLDEARRMARIDHPNVLVVHGAATHDDRTGIWTELVVGATLEERLDEAPRAGVEELISVGCQLGQALAAVHGAGLVHGDLKAANVMEDEGGRLILMDFGASREAAAGSAPAPPAVGTPLVMAPEVLLGAPPTPAADIYALGVLLYRLAVGSYPVTAESRDQLRRRHAHGPIESVAASRPDLPPSLVALIDRALARDPDRRHGSASALAEALAGAGRGPAHTASMDDRPDRPWRHLAAAAAVAAVILIAFNLGRPPPEPVMAPLAATATFVHGRGGPGVEPLVEGSLVRPGDAIGLELELAEDAYVYVLNEDRSGEVYVLFPLADSDLVNPLPGGPRHRLPGGRDNVRLDWQVTSGRGEEWFLVVVSREAIPWLESQLEALPASSMDQPVLYAQLDRGVLRDRGVGGLTADPDGASPEVAELLSDVATRLRSDPDRSSSLWLQHLVVYNLGH